MREILFRGKRLNNREWKFGSYAYQYGCHEILLESCEGEYGFDHYEVDPATVCQYTGLKDKNGKRIFEGDVLRITDRYGKALNWTVEFRRGGFFGKHPNCDFYWSVGDLKGYTVEVVGNIHDNPELLVGGNGDD